MKKCFFIFLLFISPSSFLQAQKKLRFEPIEYTSETILKCQGEFKKKQDSLRNLDPPKYLIEFPSMFPEPDFQGKTTLDKYLSTFLKGKK